VVQCSLCTSHNNNLDEETQVVDYSTSCMRGPSDTHKCFHVDGLNGSLENKCFHVGDLNGSVKKENNIATIFCNSSEYSNGWTRPMPLPEVTYSTLYLNTKEFGKYFDSSRQSQKIGKDIKSAQLSASDKSLNETRPPNSVNDSSFFKEHIFPSEWIPFRKPSEANSRNGLKMPSETECDIKKGVEYVTKSSCLPERVSNPVDEKQSSFERGGNSDQTNFDTGWNKGWVRNLIFPPTLRNSTVQHVKTICHETSMKATEWSDSCSNAMQGALRGIGVKL